jgi:hypothetical protein
LSLKESVLLEYIKAFVAGIFLEIADAKMEDDNDTNSAKFLIGLSAPFLTKGLGTISYYLVAAKVEYSQGFTALAKTNYDIACKELDEFPEFRESYEIKGTLEKFKCIYGY